MPLSDFRRLPTPVVAALIVSSAHAATPTALTWDADPAAPGIQDGPGTWDTTLANFRDPVAGTNYIFDNAINHDITFGNSGTAGIVALGAGVITHSLTFSTVAAGSAYTITANAGATLTFAGATSGPALTANANATIAAPVAGNAATITKFGTAALTLAATNTYTGQLLVSAGTLQARSAAALPGYAGGRLAIASGATLALNVGGASEWTSPQVNALLTTPALGAGSVLAFDTANGSFSHAGTIGGGIGLTKNGSNTLTLTAANTYSGPTTIRGGTLALTGAGRLPANAAVTFADFTLLSVGAGVNQTVSAFNVPATTASGFVGGAGSVTFTGTSLGAGNQSQVDLTTLGGFIFNQPTAALNVNGNGTQTQLPNNTVITASALNVGTGDYGGVTNTSTRLTLRGSTTINADAIRVGSFHADGAITASSSILPPPPSYTVTLRGTSGGRVGAIVVGFNSAAQQSQSSSFNVSDYVLDARIGKLTIGDYEPTSGTATTSAYFYMKAGILDATSISLAYSRAVGYGDGGTVNGTFNQSAGTVKAGTLTLGVVGNSGQQPTKLNATYNLGSSGSFATLMAGTITAGENGSINGLTTASRTINFSNGRITTYDAASNLVISGLLNGGSLPTTDRALKLVLSTTGTHALTAPAGRTINVADSTFVSGGGALTIDGPGTVILNGSNTYSGGTVITAGTLRLAEPAFTPVLSYFRGADVQNGRLVFDYGTTPNPAATIRSLLAASFATGFTSPTARLRSTTATPARGLGYADSGTAVTVMATLYGDTDLDGDVSIYDFNNLANAFGKTTGQTWRDGDFDYDGGVSIEDFNRLAASFGQSLTGPAAAIDFSGLLAFAAAHDDLAAFEAVTGVPEPGAIGLLAAGAVLGRRRRRRRRRRR